jgi:kynureninase
VDDLMLDLGPYPDVAGFDLARQLDMADPLAKYRQRFFVADDELIYLDGNSLGRLPSATGDHLLEVIQRQWGADLIESWGNSWWRLASKIGDEIAPLVGAAPGSVVVADSTSVCLYKLALGAMQHRPDRNVIVTDESNFPTDLYVLSAAAEAAGGRRLVVVPDTGGAEADEDGIIAALDADTALLSLSHVAFKSGYMYDMERITNAAHDAGALVLWDLSHSAGVVPMHLGNVDLAVGCTYKYLNGGPGAPAFLYVNPSLDIANPLTGWWGHAEPFSFEPTYRAAGSIERFQTGTMPILSLSAIAPAVAIIREAGVDAIRAKSIQLTSYLIDLADELLTSLGFSVASPRQSERRGSHVSLRHPDAWRITRAMIDKGHVVPDFREPDNIRLGLAPLYTTYGDVHTALQRIRLLVSSGVHERYSVSRTTVT